MRRFLAVTLPIVTFFISTGCGKSGSPTSPSVGSASITGAIVAPAGSTSGLAAMPSSASGSGVTVSVPGTSISTPVDGNNRFTLNGVPSGDVIVQFSGSGLNGQVPLTDVQPSESISMSVSLDGSSVSLETLNRTAGSQSQLEGRVESLPPTTAAGAFVVAGQTVLTGVQTQFLRGDSPATFADLAIGIRVHVSGQAATGGLMASTVEIQNTNADLPVEINGVIADFSGSPSAFQFTIDGRLIKGDMLTNFFGGSTFGDLANGLTAEVKGQQRDAFVYATDIHVNVPDTGGSQDESASIDGTLMSKSGSVPTLTLVVGTTMVATSADTVVQRRGDVQDLTVLQLGMDLHVVGDRQSDGSINARLIQIKDDQSGGQFEVAGAMGGVSGACPAIRFVVNGYSIATDSSTAFTPACAGLKSGTKVLVKGIVQTDGSVKATSVDKQ